MSEPTDADRATASELWEAVMDHEGVQGGKDLLADALAAAGRAKAGAELRAAADYWDRPNIRTIAHDLRERANALEAHR